MSPICILGIGSPFGDDRLGWETVHLLKQQPNILKLIPQILCLETCDRPAVRMLHKLTQVKIAILIDAVKSEAPLGSLHLFSHEAIMPTTHPVSSHGWGLAESLKLAKELGILPETTVLYGIEINEITFTSELSDSIKIAVNKLANLLSQIPWQELVSMDGKKAIFAVLYEHFKMNSPSTLLNSR